jgi:hypothetical protein
MLVRQTLIVPCQNCQPEILCVPASSAGNRNDFAEQDIYGLPAVSDILKLSALSPPASTVHTKLHAAYSNMQVTNKSSHNRIQQDAICKLNTNKTLEKHSSMSEKVRYSLR